MAEGAALFLTAAVGGAGLGFAAAPDHPLAGMALGALGALLLAAWESRLLGRPKGLGWAYLPGALLFLTTLVSRLPVPAAIARDFDFQALAAAQALIPRYAFLLLGVTALALSFAIRAWILRWGGGEWKRPGRWVWIGVALAAPLFAVLAVLACRSFHRYVDLAAENEVIWRLAFQGKPYSLLNANLEGGHTAPNYWTYHLGLMWALIAPLYRLWPGPYLPLVLQAFFVCSAALPLYAVLKDRLGPTQAAGLALAFLIYPTVQYSMCRDLHSPSWAVPFTIGLWWALRARRWGLSLLLAALAVSCREDVSMVLFGIGFALCLERGWRKTGALLLLLSGLLFVFLVQKLMPSLGGSADWRNWRFAWLGHSNGEILHTLLTRPFFVAAHLLEPSRLVNATIFLLPLCALPLLGGRRTLVALPLFGVIFLVENVGAYSFEQFYTMPSLPFLFLGAAEGLLLLERWGGRRLRDAAWVGVLASALASTVVFGPSPIGITFWDKEYVLGIYSEPYYHRSVYAQTGHAARGRALLARIPDDAVVSAQAFFLPHLARTKLMLNVPKVEGADYVLLDVSHPNRYEFHSRRAEFDPFLARLRTDPAWTCIHDEDGYLLFQRARGAR